MHFVYFVQPVDGGPIKIGITNDLERRLAGLQTGSPAVLVLRHFIEVDDAAQAHALEQDLHRRYAAFRQHGEWFDAAPDLAKFAHAKAARVTRKCKAATPDEDQLRLDFSGAPLEPWRWLTMEMSDEEFWRQNRINLQHVMLAMGRA